MLSLPPCEQAITESDAFIEQALLGASIPTLMMSMIHMSGDAGLLDGDVRPGTAIPGEVQGFLSDAEQATVRARALEVIRAYRDRGCTLPPPPSPQTIRRMMSFVVGEPIPDEYLPMMLEEMALDGHDARAVDFSDVPSAVRADFRVLVIGAGMSGLLTAIKLEAAGIPYVVLEKNETVGGTWHENRYPGCRVDVANAFYCYSFEPNHDWSEHFSRQPELLDYFERCATKYGVRQHVRFGTEVVSARWDEGEAAWTVRTRRRGGDEETLRANAIVSAVGQLNRPKLPEIEGLERFQGPAFHSAQWEPQHPLEGRDVAVIGTGASAFQIVPELAKVVRRLVVFQRSAPWMGPNPAYHDAVPEGHRWLLKHLPFYARWYRFLIFWPTSDGMLRAFVVDPEWPHPERSVSALNDVVRQRFADNIISQVGDDPELLAKVLPTYPPFVKRFLQDNGSWLRALKRENVVLETHGAARITERAVVAGDGTEYPADLIVFATGFHASRFLWPMQITGRRGTSLEQEWGEDPQAYLGITVPGYPNLFCLYGPNTNLAHAGSIIFHSECQVRYILGCLHALLRGGHRAMDCREAVNDAFNARLDEAMAKLVLAWPGEGSWYKNSKGRVTATSPWRLVDYWDWTRAPQPGDYEWW